jgi:hypothetical protein
VDASGRHSKVPEWIAAVGYQAPPERIVNGFLGYASRMYRIPDAGPNGWLGAYVQAAPPEHSRGAVILPVESNRWHLTLAGVGGDYPPTDEPGFLSFAASLRSRIVYEAIRDAEPLTPIAGFRATENRWRSYETVKSWPQGLIVLGDAACAFNPVYAQGMTVAAREAVALRDCLASGPNGIERRFLRAAAGIVDDAWSLATGVDLAQPTVAGPRPARVRLINAYLRRLHAAAEHDPQLALAFIAVVAMLDRPQRLLHPARVARVLTAGLRAGKRPGTPARPAPSAAPRLPRPRPAPPTAPARTATSSCRRSP